MKKLSLLVLLVANVAFASSEKTLDWLSELANDQPSNGRGSSVSKYDVSQFNMTLALNDLNNDYNSGSEEDSCRYDIVVGRRSNIKSLEDSSIQRDSNISETLKKLNKAKKIKTIISAQWDGDSGDSEYCKIYDFRVYMNDGFMLDMEFNHTD